MKVAKEGKTVTITLNATTVELVNEVLSHRREGSFNSLLADLIEQGANSLLYRYTRNKSKWAENKLNRQTVNSLQERIKELEGNKSQD